MNTLRNILHKPWIYLAVIIIGTLLKFHRLNSKLFWADEISSVLYTAGIRDSAYLNKIPVNEIRSSAFYDSFLRLSTKPYPPTTEITGILSDTHLTPAHYIFLTLWYRLAGDETIDYRLFSVFIFIISLPFLFLLAKTLFHSSLSGWMATSLYAVSPFINLKAQEARYYILWVFCFIVSNYLFLKAINQNKLLWWLGYIVASILALYTSALSCMFILGHLIYVFMYKQKPKTQFAVSFLFIGLAYLPWMYFLYTVRATIEDGLAWHKFGLPSLFTLNLLFYQLSGFVKSFIYLFDSSGIYLSAMRSGTKPLSFYTSLITDFADLAFILYAIFYLFKKSSREISRFLLLIILPLFLALYVSDVIRNGFTSILWQYQIVNMVGISLIVANLLKDKIAAGNWLYMGIYFLLLLVGVFSILKIEAAPCWNTNPDCASNLQESQLISHAVHPLIITDFNKFGLVNFLAVLHDSKAKEADVLYSKRALPDLKEKIAGKAYSEIDILQASDTLAQQVKSQFGKSMMPYRKEVNIFSPQIWQIKL